MQVSSRVILLVCNRGKPQLARLSPVFCCPSTAGADCGRAWCGVAEIIKRLKTCLRRTRVENTKAEIEQTLTKYGATATIP
jgi:hypothetical protein